MQTFKSGNQVRELCSDFNGNRFLGRYGFVVDRADENTVSVLWTHDSLGLYLIGSGRMDITDLQETGLTYSELAFN
jgi:hypothetical protein